MKEDYVNMLAGVLFWGLVIYGCFWLLLFMVGLAL